jgi:uncharacterized protein YdcH (DUF465 family)
MPLEANAIAHRGTQTIIIKVHKSTSPELNLMGKGFDKLFAKQENLDKALNEFKFRSKLTRKEDYENMKKEVLDEIMMAATGEEETDPAEIGDMIREKLLPLADFEN